MCLYPKAIDNPKYKPNNKNGGQVPPINDIRTLNVMIPCNNCIECRKQKQREWLIRLSEEIKHTPNGYFITLTFNDQSIYTLTKNTTITGYTLDNYIAKTAIRKFLERWRKQHKKSLRHWLTTELGHNGTENIHLHGIIWFDNKEDIHKLDQYWQYGYTWKGTPIYEQGKIKSYNNYVNTTTIAYITKYVSKTDEKHKYYKPIILSSPGIGNQYTKNTQSQRNIYNAEDTKLTYRTETGHEIILPKYYKNKLYTDQQKENLWIIQMNKEERYILGQKTTTDEEYINLLESTKAKNTRLKYGDNTINYTQKENEQKIRKQIQDQRITQGMQKIIDKAIKNNKLPKAPF